MKKQDLILLAGVVLLFAPFFLSETVFEFYKEFNREHSLITSFLKFAVLATIGEILGLRIRTGSYYQKGFGVLPRALVWGFYGLTIKVAFVIFYTGAPVFIEEAGLKGASQIMSQPLSGGKVLTSFAISASMNLFYAPVLMTMHKITDTHIVATGGTLRGLFKPIGFALILKNINWDMHWHFILKKTIPLFWIPAHTFTFLLPPDYQVLSAALLGIALGVLLAVAAPKPV